MLGRRTAVIFDHAALISILLSLLLSSIPALLLFIEPGGPSGIKTRRVSPSGKIPCYNTHTAALLQVSDSLRKKIIQVQIDFCLTLNGAHRICIGVSVLKQTAWKGNSVTYSAFPMEMSRFLCTANQNANAHRGEYSISMQSEEYFFGWAKIKTYFFICYVKYCAHVSEYKNTPVWCFIL